MTSRTNSRTCSRFCQSNRAETAAVDDAKAINQGLVTGTGGLDTGSAVLIATSLSDYYARHTN